MLVFLLCFGSGYWRFLANFHALASREAVEATGGALQSKPGLEPWKEDQGVQGPLILSSSPWLVPSEARPVLTCSGGVLGPRPVGLSRPRPLYGHTEWNAIIILVLLTGDTSNPHF